MMLTLGLIFLYRAGRYRFVDSVVSRDSRCASLTLRSARMSWRLIHDRGQIDLECQSPPCREDDWLACYPLRELISGSEGKPSLLTKRDAAWLRRNLDRVEARFATDRLRGATIRKLTELQRRDAERYVG